MKNSNNGMAFGFDSPRRVGAGYGHRQASRTPASGPVSALMDQHERRVSM